MTTVYYRLSNGKEVATLAEARESGLTYTTIHREQLHREDIVEKEPTAEQLASREKRWEKMTAHFEREDN